MAGALGTANLFLDESHVGKIGMGDTLTVDVSPGQHEVIVEYTTIAGVVSVGGDRALQVPGGTTKGFECGVGTFGTFFMKPTK